MTEIGAVSDTYILVDSDMMLSHALQEPEEVEASCPLPRYENAAEYLQHQQH